MILVTEVKGSHPKNRKPTKKWPKRADLLETNFLFTSLEWCENHFSFLDMPFFLFLMLSIREATLVTWQACGTLWGGKANHVLPMIQGGRRDFWCYCRGGSEMISDWVKILFPLVVANRSKGSCQKHNEGGAQNCAAISRKWVPSTFRCDRLYLPQVWVRRTLPPNFGCDRLHPTTLKSAYAFRDVVHISHQ